MSVPVVAAPAGHWLDRGASSKVWNEKAFALLIFSWSSHAAAAVAAAAITTATIVARTAADCRAESRYKHGYGAPPTTSSTLCYPPPVKPMLTVIDAM